MCLGVQQGLSVDGVDLYLMTASVNVCLHESRDLSLTLRVAEDGIMDLDGEGTAVKGVREIRLGEGKERRKRTLRLRRGRGRIICREGSVCAPSTALFSQRRESRPLPCAAVREARDECLLMLFYLKKEQPSEVNPV